MLKPMLINLINFDWLDAFRYYFSLNSVRNDQVNVLSM